MGLAIVPFQACKSAAPDAREVKWMLSLSFVLLLDFFYIVFSFRRTRNTTKALEAEIAAEMEEASARGGMCMAALFKTGRSLTL